MNKSDIMKAAEEYRVVEPESITLGSWLEVLEALQAAAELLKQVEVLPEGSEPMMGDIVLLGGEVERVEQVLADSYIVESHLAKYDLDCYEAIIQRNGKPVIIEKEGV